jgi:alkylation response protein AidB-like acyl-CoA dehydrogenase
MSEYKAPLRDLQFVINEVFDFESHYAALPGAEDATPDMVDAILTENVRFSEEVLAPLNRVGDTEGCVLQADGTVKTPTGFKEAYQQYVDGGWPSLPHSAEYGGQGLPHSLDYLLKEFSGAANSTTSPLVLATERGRTLTSNAGCPRSYPCVIPSYGSLNSVKLEHPTMEAVMTR